MGSGALVLWGKVICWCGLDRFAYKTWEVRRSDTISKEVGVGKNIFWRIHHQKRTTNFIDHLLTSTAFWRLSLDSWRRWRQGKAKIDRLNCMFFIKEDTGWRRFAVWRQGSPLTASGIKWCECNTIESIAQRTGSNCKTNWD